MKRCILAISVLFIVTSLFGQENEKNRIYIVGLPSAGIYDYKGNVAGGGSFESKFSYGVGVEYGREIVRNLEVLTGVNYTNSKIDWEGSTSSMGPGVEVRNGSFNINYISIPLQARCYLGNFFFVNGGGILNFKVSSAEETRDENDKFGLLFGIGGKVDIKERYCLIINPYFQMNYLSSDRHMNFYNLGVKVGLGYKF